MTWPTYALGKDYPILLINPSITSHIFHLFFLGTTGMRTSDFHPLSKLQSYSMILSTTVIVLYIRSSDFIHLIAESLYASNNFSLFPYHPAPGNYYSAFCVYEFDFLIKFYIWSKKKTLILVVCLRRPSGTNAFTFMKTFFYCGPKISVR